MAKIYRRLVAEIREIVPPQVEGKFPMRETVEVSLFPAELPKKVILSAKNAENSERFEQSAKMGVSLREKHPTY